MGKLADIVEQEGRGSLPAEVRGLPSLDLTEMQGTSIPGNDWDIIGVLGDILMCEMADGDGENVKRDGIIIPISMEHKLWRVAKVKMVGPSCSDHVKIGDYVMYPSDRGIPMVGINKEKIIFLNEDRIFCICKPKDESNASRA